MSVTPRKRGGNDEILHGLCRFEGEDRYLPERLKAQREQMRWWIQRQMEERGAAEKARRDAEDAYQEVVLSRDGRATTLARMEEECRRRLNDATATFNRALVQGIHSIRAFDLGPTQESGDGSVQFI